MAGRSATPPRRWVRIAFGASLAMNLLVIGLVVGAALRFGGPDGARHMPRGLGPALYRALPRDDRKALRAEMKRAHHGGQDSDLTEITGALKADPFDAVALTALLDRHADARRAWQADVQTAWLARISAMEPAERALYADRLAKVMSHRKGRRRSQD